MRDELRALVRLSEIDDSARDLERELAEIPERLSGSKADLSRLEGMLEGERRELADAQALRDTQLVTISQGAEALSRAKAKGAKARNAREVEASEREMEIVRRSIREREEEGKKLVEAIAQKQASLASREEKIEEFHQLFQEEEAQAKVRVEELRAECVRVTAGREVETKKIPREVLSRYERVRKKIGSGVAEVVDGTCRGCRLQIPPQQWNVLRTATTMEQCPHCLRLIYFKPSLVD